MNEIQSGSKDLLDTTDSLEAVGVFKGWKNFFFIIMLLCLLLLQASFWLVDRGYITVSDQPGNAIADKEGPTDQAGSPAVAGPGQTSEPADPNVVDPNQRAPEPNEAIEPTPPAPQEDAGGGATEPNLVSQLSPLDTAHFSQGQARLSENGQVSGLQHAITWPSGDFLSGVTFGQLAWMIRLVNAVLLLAATLYCLTLLFGLKVSMHGRLGGISHISRAFFLSLIMLVLLLPWQTLFGDVLVGAMYTPRELAEWCSAEAEDIFDLVLYYLRFSGYGALMLLLLLLSQFRSMRWAKAILRRLEII